MMVKQIIMQYIFYSMFWAEFYIHTEDSEQLLRSVPSLFFKGLATRKRGLNLALPKDLCWLWGFSGFPKNLAIAESRPVAWHTEVPDCTVIFLQSYRGHIRTDTQMF